MLRSKEEFPFEKLFSNEIKLKLKLLNILYKESEGLSVDELASNVSVSQKTAYKYIKDLNYLSKNFYSKNSISISSRNNHYTFEGDKIEYLTIRYLIIEKSDKLQLILALIPNSSVNKYDFCSRYFISESTLKNYIGSINSVFSRLNIHLISKKNEIYLIGNEVLIRYCFVSIIWRTYNGLKWPFESILNTSKLLGLRKQVQGNTGLSIDFGKQDVFITLIAVSIIRFNISHNISEEQLPLYKDELINSLSNINELKSSLQKIFLGDKLEVDFISLNLFLFPEQNMIFSLNESTLSLLKKKKKSTFNSCISFINFFQEKYPNWNIESNRGQIFIAAVLSAHIATDLYKQACFNIQDLNLFAFFSSEFPMLYPSILKITKTFNPTLSSDLLESLSFHLSKVFLLDFLPREFEPEINVLVITDSPAYVERGTLFQIKSILRYKYNLKISTKVSSLEYIDLIISTGSYTNMPKHIPTIYVFPQIIERDVEIITTAYEKIYKNKIDKLFFS